MTYTWLDRLTAASGGSLPALAYTYDAVGNRLTKVEAGTTTSYSYGRYNKISSDTIWTNYTHDPNGNIAWKKKTNEEWNYQFNSLDQLTKVVKRTYDTKKKVWTSSTVGEYWYDANGARAKSVEGAATIEYVFLGHDPLCEKSGTTWTRYVYVNGRLEAKLVGTDKIYYISDALGSTRQVWKHGANSAAFSVATYKPFGIPVTVSGTEKVRYAGELFDTSTGLYYIFARYMDPELGRFVSLDPELGSLSMPQTMNRYVYCVNNPLGYVDPTGMFWETVFDIGCIIYDIYELQENPTWENVGWLLLDVGCLIAPGVPALSPLFKGLKAADRADDARKITDKGEDLSDIVRHADDLPTGPGRSVDTFLDGKRVTLKLEQDLDVYRIFGGSSQMRGSWFALTPPGSRHMAQDLYSLPSGNTAEFCARATIPRGAVVDIGIASPMFGRTGGGVQVFVRNSELPTYFAPWRIPG